MKQGSHAKSPHIPVRELQKALSMPERKRRSSVNRFRKKETGNAFVKSYVADHGSSSGAR